MQKTELDRLAIGLMVLFCTIWGLQQVAIKIASAGISPIWQAGLRSIGASVIVLLWSWGAPVHAAAVAALVLGQFALMGRLLANPRERAPWYNATGVLLFVIGMLISAFAVRPDLPGAP